ncbi:hypothetical protein AALO_G00087740 [Alosa alosa]|uniref:Ubiquitin-like domain-containing protein n=1 Tax=Alosa alosa TaxID=278164 RepID=A0AAV6H2U5_9TELE|nr:transmembrane and ubiquitin-like domain-containing protein 1 [Alosa alosa]KAG5280321.1 hypothetical protein AALO_G00087740 [Alosa alosa]
MLTYTFVFVCGCKQAGTSTAPTKRKCSEISQGCPLPTPELRSAMAVFALMMLEEGVGDEVTLVGGVLLLALAMVLAWLSTHVAENGDHMMGTIISPLVGLGNADPYSRSAPSADPVEPEPTTHSQEDKPEDEDSGLDSAGGEDSSLDDASGPAVSGVVDQHLDIQGLHKRTVVPSSPVSAIPSSLPSEECLDTEKGKPTEGMTTSSSSSATATDITVRLKFLNDTEELAVLGPQATVGLLTSKYFSGKERQIKLIFQGQLLRDPNQTLLSLNITHNSVIHCHISQNAPPEGAPPGADPRSEGASLGSQAESRMDPGAGSAPAADGGLDMNVGSLVVPMFVLTLAVIWYFRINYRQLFTAPATISLVGVTIFFSFLIFGMYGR